MTDPDDDRGPSFPLPARVAGWVWVGLGAAHVLGVAAACVRLSVLEGIGVAVFLWPVPLLALCGCDLLVRGHHDPLPAGVVSLAVGGLGLLAFAAAVLANLPLGQFVIGVPGTLYATAGLLALTSRPAYLRWRAGAGGGP